MHHVTYANLTECGMHMHDFETTQSSDTNSPAIAAPVLPVPPIYALVPAEETSAIHRRYTYGIHRIDAEIRVANFTSHLNA